MILSKLKKDNKINILQKLEHRVTGNKVVGFITVSASEIAFEDLPSQTLRRLPEYPLPVMRIARLAIDKQLQGLGLGKKILRSSFQLA